MKVKDKELSETLSFVNACFYIAWDRYSNGYMWSQTLGEYICVIDFDEDEKLRDSVEGLEGGDNEMIEGCRYINKKLEQGRCVAGVGLLPSDAVREAESKAQKWFENNKRKAEQ